MRGFLAGAAVLGALGACTLAGPPAWGPPDGAHPLPPGDRRTAPRPAGDEAGSGAAGEEARARSPAGRPLPAGFRTRPRFREVRALWVVRTSLTDPDSARTMVRRAHDAGFNTLLVQVRGRGDAYYRSRLEPPPTALSDAASSGYDPLGLVLDEAHARGMAVHAWVNAHLVAGTEGLPEDPRHLVNARPAWLAVPRSLARELHSVEPTDLRYVGALLGYAREHAGEVEGLYTSPAHPAVQEHLYGIVTDLAGRYELDGIHLDYIRYPGPEFDYSPIALDRFRERVAPRLPPERRAELDRALERDPLAYADGLPGRWAEFRRGQITDLVRRSYFGIKRRNPDLLVSAAVRPDPVEARRERFQDWPTWLHEWIVDVAALMSYVPEEPFFRHLVAEGVEVAGGERIWAGIGAYRTTLPGAVNQIRIAREVGAGGVSLFSYDWAVAGGEAGGAGEPFLLRVGEEAFGARGARY